jgi:hypothetical protein
LVGANEAQHLDLLSDEVRLPVSVRQRLAHTDWQDAVRTKSGSYDARAALNSSPPETADGAGQVILSGILPGVTIGPALRPTLQRVTVG